MLMNSINDNQEVHKEIKESLLPIMGDWCGLSLKSAVVYGIRRYLRGSWLGLHVDRLPTHIISVILQVKCNTSRGYYFWSGIFDTLKISVIGVVLYLVFTYLPT